MDRLASLLDFEAFLAQTGQREQAVAQRKKIGELLLQMAEETPISPECLQLAQKGQIAKAAFIHAEDNQVSLKEAVYLMVARSLKESHDDHCREKAAERVRFAGSQG